jgi:hypothetical protein
MPGPLRRQGVNASMCVSNTISSNSLSINNILRIRISIRARNPNTSSKVQPMVSNSLVRVNFSKGMQLVNNAVSIAARHFT